MTAFNLRREGGRVLSRFGLLDVALEAELFAARRLSLGSYRQALDFYARFIGRGDLCFDIGANLGQKTVIFNDLGARVIAVDPQSSCVKKLRAAFRSTPRVTIVPKAVGAVEGYADFFVCDQSSTISTMSEEFRSHGRFSTEATWNVVERVPVTTMDALIGEYGVPAFCKIDVEGFEESVLAGLSQPIPNLSFELNSEFVTSAERAVARLGSLGYDRFNFVPNRSPKFLFREWVDPATLFATLQENPNPRWVGEIYATTDETTHDRGHRSHDESSSA